MHGASCRLSCSTSYSSFPWPGSARSVITSSFSHTSSRLSFFLLRQVRSSSLSRQHSYLGVSRADLSTHVRGHSIRDRWSCVLRARQSVTTAQDPHRHRDGHDNPRDVLNAARHAWYQQWLARRAVRPYSCSNRRHGSARLARIAPVHDRVRRRGRGGRTVRPYTPYQELREMDEEAVRRLDGQTERVGHGNQCKGAHRRTLWYSVRSLL